MSISGGAGGTDHSTDEVFRITLVTIPRDDGGRFQFAVDVASHRITASGVSTSLP